MDVVDLAKICHEANKAYCESHGDHSQVSWAAAEDWQRESMIQGVKFRLTFMDLPPSASHEAWLAHKAAEGWVYGPVKDAEKKTHPCIMPFDQLPSRQQRKDMLSTAIIRSLCS